MSIPDIAVNGHTYTDADWETDWDRTLRSIAADIVELQEPAAALRGQIDDEKAGLIPLPMKPPPERIIPPFPVRALRSEPGAAPFLPYGEA